MYGKALGITLLALINLPLLGAEAEVGDGSHSTLDIRHSTFHPGSGAIRANSDSSSPAV